MTHDQQPVTVEAAEKAQKAFDRLSWFLRVATLAGVTAIVVLTAVFGVLLYLRQTAAARDNHRVLTIIEQATNPANAKTEQRAVTHIIVCLYNRIDVDTGHGRTDPSCADLGDG